MDRAGTYRLARLSALSGGAVLGGFLHHYYVSFLRPTDRAGNLGSYYESIVEGTGNAPFQYRVLVSRLVVWVHDLSGVSYRLAAVFVDGFALFAAGLLLLALLHRWRLGPYSLPVALYVAFWGYGTTTFWKPESFWAFLAVGAIALAFTDRIGSTRPLLVFGIVVLAGTRTDVLAAVAVAFGARWWWEREREDLIAGAAALAVAMAATLAAVALVPDATYPPGVSVIQLSHSLRPNNLLIPALFALPAVAPLLHLRRPWRHSLGTDQMALLLAIAASSVASIVAGRADEVRLWFPFAGVLGAIGMSGWLAAARTSQD